MIGVVSGIQKKPLCLLVFAPLNAGPVIQHCPFALVVGAEDFPLGQHAVLVAHIVVGAADIIALGLDGLIKGKDDVHGQRLASRGAELGAGILVGQLVDPLGGIVLVRLNRGNFDRISLCIVFKFTLECCDRRLPLGGDARRGAFRAQRQLIARFKRAGKL